MFRKITNNPENMGLPYNYAEFICDTVNDIQDLPTNIANAMNKETVAIGSKAMVLDVVDIYILNNQNEWVYFMDGNGSGAITGIRNITIDENSNLVFEMTDGKIFKVHLEDDDELLTKSRYDYLAATGKLKSNKKYHITDNNGIVNYYESKINSSNPSEDHTASVKAVVDYIQEVNNFGIDVHVTTDNAGFYKVGDEIHSNQSIKNVLKDMLYRPFDFSTDGNIVYFKDKKYTRKGVSNGVDGYKREFVEVVVDKYDLIYLNPTYSKVTVESQNLLRIMDIQGYHLDKITVTAYVDGTVTLCSATNPTLDDDGLGHRIGRVSLPLLVNPWSGKSLDDDIYGFTMNVSIEYTDDQGVTKTGEFSTYHSVNAAPAVRYACTTTDAWLNPQISSNYINAEKPRSNNIVTFECKPKDQYIQLCVVNYNGMQYDIFDDNDIKCNNAFNKKSSVSIGGGWYAQYVSKNKYSVGDSERLRFVLKEKEVYD